MRLEQGVFPGSLADYGVSLTDELEGFLKSATARARAPSRIPFSQVRSMIRIIMTRIILGAIAFAFGAAMSAQAEGISPPPFEPSSCAKKSALLLWQKGRPTSLAGAGGDYPEARSSPGN